MKCRQTAVLLKHNPQIQLSEILVETGTKLIKSLQDKGYRSMPIVLVKDSQGNTLDAWSDFQVDKVAKWRNHK